MIHLPKGDYPVHVLWGLAFLKICWTEIILKNDNGSTYKVSVDGTDFCIQQPRPFNKMWYSHKFNGPVLRYGVAISVKSVDIV